MGVYIKGMEMPTSCGVCPLMRTVEYEEICPLLGQYACRYDRNEDCPLVPVPPHGRLVDADALGYFPYNMDFCDGGEADEWVQNAPTIIPAEEGET